MAELLYVSRLTTQAEKQMFQRKHGGSFTASENIKHSQQYTANVHSHIFVWMFMFIISSRSWIDELL